MMVSFGLSWPISVIKSYKARTAKGKSLLFLAAIFVGYICGITSKLVAEKITYVLIVYIINFCIVCVDISLYFRNLRLDRLADASRSRVEESGVSDQG